MEKDFTEDIALTEAGELIKNGDFEGLKKFRENGGYVDIVAATSTGERLAPLGYLTYLKKAEHLEKLAKTGVNMNIDSIGKNGAVYNAKYLAMKLELYGEGSLNGLLAKLKKIRQEGSLKR